MDPSNFCYLNHLVDIFPNHNLHTIENTIQTVLEQSPNVSDEYYLEDIINLLADTTGAHELTNNEDINHLPNLENEHYDKLLNIFNDASPVYLRNLCRKMRHCNIEDLIDEMMTVEYPKNEVNPQEVFAQLQEMLPCADPSFLEKQANALAYQPETHLKEFVEDAIENSDYPTMADYLKNVKEQQNIDQYTNKFSIEQFLKQFPDPDRYFSNPNRKGSLISTTEMTDDTIQEAEEYAITFLYNNYSYLRKRDIDKVFRIYSKDLIKCCSRLDTMHKALACPRQITIIAKLPKNITLLQEIAYLKHRKEIRKILKESDIRYNKLKEQARFHGLLQTCECCYNDELIPEECYFCKGGCIFCKECLKNGAENVIGDGKLDFPCLADCGSEFSISTLQMILDSVVFARMAQRKQMEEVKNANLDGLESCPFCDYSTIPLPEDKIFHCLNSDCMKESCRECRHEAHIPKRCSEIEYDEDVRMRTYIENKMTEALLRKCWNCCKVFIKESGCNKMTCSCGAGMCYVCGKAVNDYKHFGEIPKRCPLYTQDLNKFHTNAVIQGATAAKADLGVDKNPSLLKIDPTVGLMN